MIKRQYTPPGSEPQTQDPQVLEAFLVGLADDFAALRADPIAWAEELAEREAWDMTLSDGISDE